MTRDLPGRDDERTRWAALLAAAGILYLMSLGAYYVGFFNDDAFYLIGARSLAQGGYRELSHPAAPPLINYLPGYPALLAPLAALFPGSFLPCQLLSAAMTLGSVIWLRLCFRGELDPGALWAAGAAAALNPLAVSLSGTILSDIPYGLYTLLIFAACAACWKESSPKLWAGLGLLSAGAFYLRSTGLALPLALAAALLLERRFKAAASCLLPALALMALFPLRNHLARGVGLIHAQELGDSLLDAGALELGAALRRNAEFYLNELYARILFRWPAEAGAGWARLLAIGGGSLATLAGAARFLARGGWRRCVVLYAALYAAAVLLWGKQSGRYLLPALPLAAAWLFHGLAWAGGRLRDPGLLVRPALALCLLGFAPTLKSIVRGSLFGGTPLNTPPRRTAGWLSANAAPDAIVAAELDGRLHLLTGRPTLRLPKAATPRELADWARAQGVAFVLAGSTESILRTPRGAGAHDPLSERLLLSQLEASPDFALAFASPPEGTRLYRRLP